MLNPERKLHMAIIYLQEQLDNSDQALVINELLANPQISSVVLPIGTTNIGRSINVPSGKSLRGQGRGLSIIKVLPSFDAAAIANSAVCSGLGAANAAISDLTIDVNKVGSISTVRLNGVFMRRAVRFSVTDCDVWNATGYAFFAQGNTGGVESGSSGTFRNCWAYNSMVCFEQMFCQNMLLENCHARDGDGDLIGTYFHPLTKSANITYMNCTGIGAASVGVEFTANEGAPMRNIAITNCRFEMSRNVPALVLDGSQPVSGLQLAQSRFVCTGGSSPSAVIATKCSGSAVQCVFDCTGPIGSQWADGSNMRLVDCDSIARTTTAAAYGISVEGASTVYYLGGSLQAYSTSGERYTVSKSANSKMAINGGTVLVPS